MDIEQRQKSIAEELDFTRMAHVFIGLCIQATRDIDQLSLLGEEAGKHQRLIEALQRKSHWTEKIEQSVEFEAKM